MKIERALLVAFFGNYLVNNIAAAIASFLPGGSGMMTAQYIGFVVLAAITIGLMTMWYGAKGYQAGALFGAFGFAVAILTAFTTGVTGVLIQTASFSTLMSVLPNFFSFIFSTPTLVLLGYWVIPAIAVGFLCGRRASCA